jgi:hypothetical protein
MGAKNLLHDRLRYLLSRLRRDIVSIDAKAESSVEVCDLATGQRVTEDHPLRPGNLQRGGFAHGVRDVPSAQMLHRSNARGLRPWAAVGYFGPRFQHDAPNPVQSKFGGRGQARRASTDDEDRQLSLIGNAIVSHGVMVVATESASITDATEWHAPRGMSGVV